MLELPEQVPGDINGQLLSVVQPSPVTLHFFCPSQSLSAVQPPGGVPPAEQVPVPGRFGQSAAVTQVVDVTWAHTLTLEQLVPGFGQTRLVYLHLPTDAQSPSLLQVEPVAEQTLPVDGQSESCAQLLLVTLQLMAPIEVWVAVPVWVPGVVWVPVPVCVPVEVCVLVAVCELDEVCVAVAVWAVVPVCVPEVVWVPVPVLVTEEN